MSDKWSGIYFFHLKSEKLIDFEHKRGVPEKGKTENLKRKASRFDWRILYNICTSLLPQGAASRAAQADLFTSDCKERLHKQGETAILVKSGCRRVKM